MKKIFTIILCCAVLSGVHAQFTLSPKVTTAQGANSSIRSASSIFTNNATAAADTMFEWNLLEMNLQPGWGLAFCDPKDCYASISSSTTYQFIVRKGNTGLFKTDFDFLGNSGTGTIKVVIRSKMNSSVSDTLTVLANSWTTAVTEVSKPREISFFPNPVKDQITIRYNTREAVQIEVYNILGSRVKSFTHEGATSVFNVADLQNGVYFIRFRDGSRLVSRSFTKSE